MKPRRSKLVQSTRRMRHRWAAGNRSKRLQCRIRGSQRCSPRKKHEGGIVCRTDAFSCVQKALVRRHEPNKYTTLSHQSILADAEEKTNSKIRPGDDSSIRTTRGRRKGVDKKHIRHSPVACARPKASASSYGGRTHLRLNPGNVIAAPVVSGEIET